ncbi:putative aldose 1-epimerase family protein [Halenospora varia]|nr:putative aldose 1-epimerase family protein [Halenospora varia]
MNLLKLSASLTAALKAVWSGGSPFATVTALWPVNEEGKYIIQAEGIRLALTNYGASISNLWINDTNGNEVDVVLGLDHADLYPELKSNPFVNGFIGRYAGYISGASYESEGTTHQIWANAHNGTSTYNGGDQGWGRRRWDIPMHTENSITFVMFDRKKNGFPGVFVGCLTHTVTPYTWKIAYGLTPTLASGPINLSQQVFWNLDGMSTNRTNTVEGHTLHLPSAGLRFAFNEHGISTGDLLSNKKGKEYDFWSEARDVGDVIKEDSKLDETFVLSHKHPVNKHDFPAAILSSPKTGITMELYTDQDALKVHTWSEKNGHLNLKKAQGNGTVPHNGAISLEMSEWPDSVNRPEWRYRKTLVNSEDIPTAFSTYKFKVNKKS